MLYAVEDCSDLVRLEFSDSSCSVLVDDESYSSFAACSNSADSFPATESFKGFCTLNSTIPIPMDGALLRWVLSRCMLWISIVCKGWTSWCLTVFILYDVILCLPYFPPL